MNAVKSIALARCTTTVRALHNATYHRGDAMPAYRTALTQARLKELFDYSPETGEFTRLITVSSNAKAGRIAGSKGGNGYTLIDVDGKKYLAHRLAWLYTHGYFPEQDLDHINGDPLDNRLANLREATRSENLQNMRLRKDNSTGVRGVVYMKRDRRFRARIRCRNEIYNLGYFDTAAEAGQAYLKAKAELHSFQPVPRGSQ